MSEKDAQAFLVRAENDADLRGQVIELSGALDLEPLVRLAVDKGYDCDESSLRSAWRKRRRLKEVVAAAKRR